MAHSMGALLVIGNVINNPKITKAFFLQPALSPCLKPAIVICAFNMVFGIIRPDDKITLAATRCLGIQLSRNLFKYVGWIPRFWDLFMMMRKSSPLLKDFKIPCVAFVSKKDEVVSQVSGKILRRHSNIKVFEMEKSGHFYYDPKDIELVRREFAKFIMDEESDVYAD